MSIAIAGVHAWGASEIANRFSDPGRSGGTEFKMLPNTSLNTMNWFKKNDGSAVKSSGLRKRTLRPEKFERREMMAGDVLGYEVNSQTGVLHITGTDDADTVEVFLEDQGTADPTDDQLRLIMTTEGRRTANALTVRYFANGVERVRSIKFEGFGGDDYFKNHTAFESEIRGGAGDDFLVGGSGIDRIFGELGKDKLFGRYGNDFLSGGAHEDRVFGGSGNDEMHGGSHNDGMFGGSGDDEIHGNSGHDEISGWFGDDEIFGGSGNDNLRGGRGNDVILGGTGNDILKGQDGNDTLMGERGRDSLEGGDGHDFLFGGRGRDYLAGNDGNDLLVGGDGRDACYGGKGNDRLYGGDMTGINLNQANYGNPSVEKKSVAQDWDRDVLHGGDGVDFFGIADNGIFSDDHVEDRESGEIVKDLDPFWATAGSGTLGNLISNYGHLR